MQKIEEELSNDYSSKACRAGLIVKKKAQTLGKDIGFSWQEVNYFGRIVSYLPNSLSSNLNINREDSVEAFSHYITSVRPVIL